MKQAILTNSELNMFEQEIDRIKARVDFLNPNDTNDAQDLFYYDLILDDYLAVLKKSCRSAQIKESGLRIIG